jgi:hypothetical protein
MVKFIACCLACTILFASSSLSVAQVPAELDAAWQKVFERQAQLQLVIQELETIVKENAASDVPNPEQSILKGKLARVKKQYEKLAAEQEQLLAQKTPAAETPKTAEPKKEAAPAKKAAAPRNEMTPITDTPGLPRVLLIGDSISIGYTLPVRELLQGKANVHRVLTNCGPTKGPSKVDGWLVDKRTGGEKWDVIHFNFGLHDLKHSDDKGTIVDVTETSKRQVSPEDYEKNLREIVGKLKATGAKLIWCSTTPVPKGAKGRVPGDEVLYNEIALKVMKENNIAVDDLYAFALPQLDKIQNKADVHFSANGSKELAKQVVSTIEAALKK